MSGTLTPKQQRFVEEYCVDLNATQAAIRAGYSPKTAGKIGTENLTKPEIADAIHAANAERSKRTGITADRVLEELAVLGFSSVDHYLIDENGHVTLADGAPKSAIRAVSSIKRKRREITTDDRTTVEVETEIKLWSKPDALRMAGQHLSMYTEKHEHSGTVTLEDIIAGVAPDET